MDPDSSRNEQGHKDKEIKEHEVHEKVDEHKTVNENLFPKDEVKISHHDSISQVHNDSQDKKIVKKKSFKSYTVWAIVLVLVIIGVVLAVRYNSEDSGDYVALVGGEKISMEEFELRFSSIPPQLKGSLSKEEFLDQLIEEKLLLQRAKKIGIDVSEEEVNAEIESNYEGLGMTKEAFLEQLALQNLTEEDLHKIAHIQMTIRELVQKEVYPEVIVSDEDVKAYYNENPDFFEAPESVRAQHILISTAERDDKLALAVAESIRRGPEIKNFSAAAAEYSEDPGSKMEGGDLGYFTKGQMVPEFEEAAFSLEVGEVSQPIKTQFGYHLIKVIDKQEAGTQDFNEIKDQIKAYLEQLGQQEALTVYIDELKKDSSIEKNLPTE